MNTSKIRQGLLMAIAIGFMASGAWAQQQGPGGPGPAGPGPMGPGPAAAGSGGQGPALRLFEELLLDEAQQAEVLAIMEQAHVLHCEERANSFAANEAIREETHAAIMAVLDEAQQVRFQELLDLRAEQWTAGGRGQGGRRGGGAGPYDSACPNPDCPNADCPNATPPDGEG